MIVKCGRQIYSHLLTKFSIITFLHVPLASSNKFGGSLQRVKRSTFYETGKTLALKTSLTLDQLLGSHYSKRIRPDFGRKQVKVKLNLSIRSMVRLIDCMIFYRTFFSNYSFSGTCEWEQSVLLFGLLFPSVLGGPALKFQCDRRPTAAYELAVSHQGLETGHLFSQRIQVKAPQDNGTVVSYSNDNFSFKWELASLPPPKKRYSRERMGAK